MSLGDPDPRKEKSDHCLFAIALLHFRTFVGELDEDGYPVAHVPFNIGLDTEPIGHHPARQHHRIAARHIE